MSKQVRYMSSRCRGGDVAMLFLLERIESAAKLMRRVKFFSCSDSIVDELGHPGNWLPTIRDLLLVGEILLNKSSAEDLISIQIWMSVYNGPLARNYGNAPFTSPARPDIFVYKCLICEPEQGRGGTILVFCLILYS